jgi:hypothetical protein
VNIFIIISSSKKSNKHLFEIALEENTEVVVRKRAPTYVQKIFLGVESYSNKEYIEPEPEVHTLQSIYVYHTYVLM